MKQKQLTYFLVCVVGTAVFLTAYTLLFTSICMARYQKANRQFPIFRQFFQHISEASDAMDDFLINEEMGNYQEAKAALDKAEKLLISLKQQSKAPHIGRELAELEHYLYIQRQRFGKRIQFIQEVPQALPELLLPSLTLQPLVENAVTHGVGMKREGAKVWIFVADFPQKGICRMVVADNGQGMAPERLAKVEQEMEAYNGESRKIGLGNVYLRLKLLWGERISVKITGEEGKGTEIAIQITYGS